MNSVWTKDMFKGRGATLKMCIIHHFSTDDDDNPFFNISKCTQIKIGSDVLQFVDICVIRLCRWLTMSINFVWLQSFWWHGLVVNMLCSIKIRCPHMLELFSTLMGDCLHGQVNHLTNHPGRFSLPSLWGCRVGKWNYLSAWLFDVEVVCVHLCLLDGPVWLFLHHEDWRSNTSVNMASSVGRKRKPGCRQRWWRWGAKSVMSVEDRKSCCCWLSSRPVSRTTSFSWLLIG